jgi:hypothetical protein
MLAKLLRLADLQSGCGAAKVKAYRLAVAAKAVWML